MELNRCKQRSIALCFWASRLGSEAMLRVLDAAACSGLVASQLEPPIVVHLAVLSVEKATNGGGRAGRGGGRRGGRKAGGRGAGKGRGGGAASSSSFFRASLENQGWPTFLQMVSNETLSWWFGLVVCGFETAFVESKWEAPQSPNHQSTPN